MPFENPPSSLLLSATGEQTPPYIFLDGDTGEILVVGANGSVIRISGNATFPIIEFISIDGTNNAFMNITGAADMADLGINSGVFAGTDGVDRRHRLLMQGTTKVMTLATIRENNQATRGGAFTSTDQSATVAYSTDAGGIQPALRMDADGSKLNGDLISAEFKQTAEFLTIAATSSATFGNIGTAQNIDKQYTGTRIALHGGITAYANGANTVVEFQMLVNGVGHRVGYYYFNTTLDHRTIVLLGVTPTGLTAGTYSVQLQWRRVSGGGSINVDTEDYLTWDLTEKM